MAEPRPRIAGILNLTRDSFSDGGLYFEPGAAIRQAERLIEDGADVVELGPASSHPDAEKVGAKEEIRRLDAVLPRLIELDIPVAVDSYEIETHRYCLEHPLTYLNDIQGFPHPEVWEALAMARCDLVIMHSIQRRGPATRVAGEAVSIVDEIEAFFDDRIRALEDAGVARERMILDPGMGYFLGRGPTPSLAVLREIPRLRERFALPIFISVTRKSFLGALCRGPDGKPRPVNERGPATLAAELYAARHGAALLRTHDVRALHDALAIEQALA